MEERSKKLASDYRELVTYQKAMELAQEIFLLTQKFPKEERYALTDQIRRSSRSIGASIAEAWGKRVYERHFVSKLSDADSEQYETQHWLEIARNCGYLLPERCEALCLKCVELNRMVNRMILKSALFANPNSLAHLRESQAEYFVDEGNEE